MRIAIISDTHFGFGQGTEREEDPYEAFGEAIEGSLDCDLILLPGDIFDGRNPDAETLSRAMELMTRPLLRQSDIELIQGIGKDTGKISEIALMGIPMVAIHGTHERRSKGLLNPIEALEKAGFLIHLHCNGVVFGKGDERVAIQGMSGVPEQHAEETLSGWGPSPEHGCFNLLMLHQSITEFLYAPHTLDLKKIPEGFDLYVNGHIHEAKVSEYKGKPFLIAGSTIPTQLKEESEKPKGFWIIETSVRDRMKDEEGEVTEKAGIRLIWKEFKKQRRFYYRKLGEQGADEIEEHMKRIIESNPGKKPMVRLDMEGEVKDTLIDEIETRFGQEMILSIKRDKKVDKIPKKSLEEHKLSVEEMGRKILLKNLKDSGLDAKSFENFFELLVHGKSEEAMEGLIKKPPEVREKSGGKGREENKSKQTVLFGQGE